MKHCPYCGKELPGEMQFCPYCMKKLIAEQPVVVPPSKRVGPWVAVVAIIAVIAVVFALMIGLLSGSPQDAPAGDTTTTSAATTTAETNTSRQHVTVDDVTGAVNRELKTSGITSDDMLVVKTRESQLLEDNQTVSHGFTFMQEKCVLTILERDGYVTEILSGTFPGQFYMEGHNTEAEALQTAVAFAVIPLTVCYQEGDLDQLAAALLATTPEKDDSTVTLTYTYITDEWKYILIVNDTIITAGAKPVVTEPTDSTVGSGSSAEVGGTTLTTGNGVPATTTKKNGVVTTKGNVGATQTTNPGATQGGNTGNACASGHSWRTITKTVEHDEVGHYEQVVVRYNTVTIYKCAVCYDTFESLSAYYTHFEEHENSSDALVGILRDRYETSTKQVPVYGQKWVVDKKAYTEQVVVGYECRVCGATK